MGILDTATKPLRPGAGQAARTGAWAAGRGAGVLRSVTRQGEDETPGEGLDRGHSVQPGKVDKAGKAEKAPERLAKEGKGRQTAPLGSKGTANGETKGGRHERDHVDRPRAQAGRAERQRQRQRRLDGLPGALR